VDHAVSVNTIAIWPDRDAGLDEFTRVVRPGARFTRIADGLVARCASVERTAVVVVFRAMR
jgi:ubiquinone/menaquinone biosynthesis C-methylase UbiE